MSSKYVFSLILMFSLSWVFGQENEETTIVEYKTVEFLIIEKVPIFPGCEDIHSKRKCFNEKMIAHIAKNFSYPPLAIHKGIQGRVLMNFIISKKGKIKKIQANGPHPLLIKEATRIIRLLPRIQPGKQKGKPVNVPFSIPITFKLQ